MAFAQVSRCEAEAIDRAGAEVLYHHIRLLYQAAQNVFCTRAFHIKGERALASIQPDKI